MTNTIERPLLTESTNTWINRTIKFFIFLCNLLLIDAVLIRCCNLTLLSAIISLFDFFVQIIWYPLCEFINCCIEGLLIGFICGSICIILFGLPTYVICRTYDYMKERLS